MLENGQYKTIKYHVAESVATICFNRPHRLNAVVETLYLEVLAALAVADDDSEVRCIVLTGAGRAFCVGADMKEHDSGHRTATEQRAYLQLANKVCAKIFFLAKPVISAVNGFALGAGAEMAIASDFIVMKRSAFISFPEISIGTFVGGGATFLLPRAVGVNTARHLIFTGERIHGEQAKSMGLACECFDDEDFDVKSIEFAQQLASKAPISMRFAKQVLNSNKDEFLQAQETELDTLLQCMNTQDWKEGIKAFSEKRSPLFLGK